MLRLVELFSMALLWWFVIQYRRQCAGGLHRVVTENRSVAVSNRFCDQCNL